jgi:hypothetical protein
LGEGDGKKKRAKGNYEKNTRRHDPTSKLPLSFPRVVDKAGFPTISARSVYSQLSKESRFS